MLEDRRISAKTIAEQLGIWREQVGSIIREDLDMLKLSAKWVPKWLKTDLKRQRCQFSEHILEFFRRDPNNFLSLLVTWTKHGYITTARKWSNDQWGGGIVVETAPKSSGSNILLKKPPLYWLSSKGPIYQRSVLLISTGAAEGYFEGKMPRKFQKVGLVLARKCPGSTGTYNPEETGIHCLPASWSPTLFSGSGPVGLPLVPWTEKAKERSPFFVRCGGHCCGGDLVGRTKFWIFLSGLQKLEKRAKKCIELRGRYVE